MADGGIVALDVRRRTAVAGPRIILFDGLEALVTVRTAPPPLRLDRCSPRRLSPRALLALENLTLI